MKSVGEEGRGRNWLAFWPWKGLLILLLSAVKPKWRWRRCGEGGQAGRVLWLMVLKDSFYYSIESGLEGNEGGE